MTSPDSEHTETDVERVAEAIRKAGLESMASGVTLSEIQARAALSVMPKSNREKVLEDALRNIANGKIPSEVRPNIMLQLNREDMMHLAKEAIQPDNGAEDES